MKRIWIILFVLTLFFPVDAQVKMWTLEDCISYAVENNIGLMRQRLQTESAKTELLRSRLDVIPSLNFRSNAQIGFGRSIDPVTNLITFKQNLSNSYTLNSNFSLFSGFSTLNTISANKFLLKAGFEAEKIARNDLIVNILQQYYQVLYYKGLEEASKEQLTLSEAQNFRIMKMVETGKEALSKQYEMESQVSADRLAYTIAHNTANQALTTLKQMLQLESGSGFDIAMPDLSSLLIGERNYNTDSVFSIASQMLPRLRAIEYELQASVKQVAAARGAISPSLSAGGSVFTGYYKILSEDEVEQMAFRDQLKNNNSQSIYLSLNIPLFNNYLTGRNIKMAKIRKNDNFLRLEQEKNSLYTEIENACLDYNRGKDEFAAAQANREFNIKSFSAVEKKFEAGLVDVTIYSTAKTTLFRAEMEALRTKLLLMIRKLTIQFYSTGDYENIIFN